MNYRVYGHFYSRCNSIKLNTSESLEQIENSHICRIDNSQQIELANCSNFEGSRSLYNKYSGKSGNSSIYSERLSEESIDNSLQNNSRYMTESRSLDSNRLLIFDLLRYSLGIPKKDKYKSLFILPTRKIIITVSMLLWWFIILLVFTTARYLTTRTLYAPFCMEFDCTDYVLVESSRQDFYSQFLINFFNNKEYVEALNYIPPGGNDMCIALHSIKRGEIEYLTISLGSLLHGASLDELRRIRIIILATDYNSEEENFMKPILNKIPIYTLIQQYHDQIFDKKTDFFIFNENIGFASVYHLCQMKTEDFEQYSLFDKSSYKEDPDLWVPFILYHEADLISGPKTISQILIATDIINNYTDPPKKSPYEDFDTNKFTRWRAMIDQWWHNHSLVYNLLSYIKNYCIEYNYKSCNWFFDHIIKVEFPIYIPLEVDPNIIGFKDIPIEWQDKLLNEDNVRKTSFTIKDKENSLIYKEMNIKGKFSNDTDNIFYSNGDYITKHCNYIRGVFTCEHKYSKENPPRILVAKSYTPPSGSNEHWYTSVDFITGFIFYPILLAFSATFIILLLYYLFKLVFLIFKKISGSKNIRIQNSLSNIDDNICFEKSEDIQYEYPTEKETKYLYNERQEIGNINIKSKSKNRIPWRLMLSLFFIFWAISIILFLTIERPNIGPTYSLGITYSTTPRLFTGTVLMSITAYEALTKELSVINNARKMPIDHYINNFLTSNQIYQNSIIPNPFQHIGRISAIGGKLYPCLRTIFVTTQQTILNSYYSLGGAFVFAENLKLKLKGKTPLYMYNYESPDVININ
ncbi:uncharacterized protein CMU_040270 [Cryptosporidium muris RN66]|uniref:Uncharacterized protein n=1 Tax=Cryptosporidium muris (strain RN66) TaxID=441375 RepID=B6A9R7_CRYMR|nr:uncharacterized protein CMU_040270 [Cryptosporidium muris RN66]EEA04958.1 hypothetical protein CMU_040270 [Cryptosporidium muris RN66]|eukprot:XP_002139307.1 hypothetical protein [Cryptosporidium muris RN66]